MHPFFTQLGHTVLARWKAENFSLTAFPAIARVALEENPPSEVVDIRELLRDFLLEDQQPFQTQSAFGQPELVVYDNPRFYIQLLFWLDGTTDIHQHMFSGAFHVLQGSSLHSRFAFEDAESISAHLRVGNLRVLDTQLLETGRTVEIVSGAGFVHSLFHLDSPSITVVVRTHTDPGTGPQFTYLPPHLAVDPFHADALTNRRKQILDVYEAIEDPEYEEIVSEMVAELDFERGFFILQNGVAHLQNLECWDAVWDIFAQKHGRLAPLVAPTLEEILRRDALVALRGYITEPEHRFFLALLLNVPGRPQILEMIAHRFPGPPEATMDRWLAELGDSNEEATLLLETYYGDVLGVGTE